MLDEALITIPARRGKAARVRAGQQIAVINTHGEQVVDTWAFVGDDLHEFMSMEHTRAALGKLIPRRGDVLSTNHRRPILTIVEDTSPGIHDTLIAACDVWRYQGLGCKDYHDNCTDNLHAAMKELGLQAPETPSPLNLFMNIPWTTEWRDHLRSARHQAGRYGDPSGGARPRHRLLRLPSGHAADQRRGEAADGSPFPDLLTVETLGPSEA